MKQILFVCLTILLFVTCGKKNTRSDFKKWLPVIKEIELIFISDMPDSVKSYKIHDVFQKNEVTITGYEEFYRETTRNKQVETISFLKEIETVLSTEMKEELMRLREEAKNDIRTGSSLE